MEYETLAQVAQAGDRCSILEIFKVRLEWGSEWPGLIEDIPHFRGIGRSELQRFLLIQTTVSDYDLEHTHIAFQFFTSSPYFAKNQYTWLRRLYWVHFLQNHNK